MISLMLTACFNVPGHSVAKDNFESCLNKGGVIQESYPRICTTQGLGFIEEIESTKNFGKQRKVFKVGSKTVSCQGYHPVDQQCLIVDGEYFYEDIAGFEHQPGITVTIEVEQVQICDPQVLNSCPQDVGIYQYRLIKVLNQKSAPANNTSADQSVFVGEVIGVKSETDGYSVTLKAPSSNGLLLVVISPANLGINSSFDFANIALGNLLKVSGEAFRLEQSNHMTARKVVSYTDIAIAKREASVIERNRCSAVGGEISKVGKLQAEQCVQTYADAGNSCSDSSECFGRCLVHINEQGDDALENSLERGASISGACEVKNNSFGCKALVNNGVYEGTICID